MTEVKVERRDQNDTRIVFECQGIVGVFQKAIPLLRMSEWRGVNWPSIGSVSPQQAREFAAAIVAVADVVEKEGKA